MSPGSSESKKRHHRQVRNNLSRDSKSPEDTETPVTMTISERQQLAELVQQNMERHRRKQHHIR